MDQDERDPKIDARKMFAQATSGLGIPNSAVVLEWPRRPLNGRPIGQKKGAKNPSKGKVSHKAMRSSKSHPPKKYGQSPIGWE